MSSVNKRIEWIDLVKFVGIFSMVWGHSGVNETVDVFIHAFHMPVFFFLSGYLSREKFDVRRKAYTLLFPYLIFGIGLFIIWQIIGKFITVDNYGVLDFLEGLLWNNAEKSPYGCIQWFLTCLFLTETLFAIIKRYACNDTIIGGIIVGFSVLGYLYPRIMQVRMFWSLDCAFTAVVFYGVGYFVKKYFKKEKLCFMKFKTKVGITLLVFCIAIFTTWKNGYVNMRIMKYGNYFLYYISAFFIIALICGLSLEISKQVKYNNLIWRGMLYIGQNTLIVLVMNQFFCQILNWWVKGRIVASTGIKRDILDFISAVFVCILMIPIIYFLNRFVPFFVGKRIKENK